MQNVRSPLSSFVACPVCGESLLKGRPWVVFVFVFVFFPLGCYPRNAPLAVASPFPHAWMLWGLESKPGALGCKNPDFSLRGFVCRGTSSPTSLNRRNPGRSLRGTGRTDFARRLETLAPPLRLGVGRQGTRRAKTPRQGAPSGPASSPPDAGLDSRKDAPHGATAAWAVGWGGRCMVLERARASLCGPRRAGRWGAALPKSGRGPKSRETGEARSTSRSPNSRASGLPGPAPQGQARARCSPIQVRPQSPFPTSRVPRRARLTRTRQGAFAKRLQKLPGPGQGA